MTKYDLTSLARLVRDIPYLNGRTGFPERLWQLATSLNEYIHYLPIADRFRVERLDTLYTHARCLVAFDGAMLDDLIEGFGWRGLARGAWLAALKAESDCRATLESIASAGRYPNQRDVVHLALNELDGHADLRLAEQHGRILLLRDAIRQIPVEPFRLRLFDPDLQAKIDADREQVARIYATRGADAASAFMHTRPWAHVLQTSQSTTRRDVLTEAQPTAFCQEWHWGFIG